MSILTRLLRWWRARRGGSLLIGGIQENYGAGQYVQVPVQFVDANGIPVDADANPTYTFYHPNGGGTPTSIAHGGTVTKVAGTTGFYVLAATLPAYNALYVGAWTVRATGAVGGSSRATVAGFAYSRYEIDVTSADATAAKDRLGGLSATVDVGSRLRVLEGILAGNVRIDNVTYTRGKPTAYRVRVFGTAALAAASTKDAAGTESAIAVYDIDRELNSDDTLDTLLGLRTA